MKQEELTTLLKEKDINVIFNAIKILPKEDFDAFLLTMRKKGRVADSVKLKGMQTTQNMGVSVMDYKGGIVPYGEADIDIIQPNPQQARKIYTKDEVERRKKSIKRFGLITPITVHIDEQGVITLVAGQLRLEAYKLLRDEEGSAYQKIKYFVKSKDTSYINNGEIGDDSAIENLSKVDMCLTDTVENIERLYQKILAQNPRISIQKFADEIGMSESKIYRYFNINKLKTEDSAFFNYLNEKNIKSPNAVLTIIELRKSTEERIELLNKFLKDEISLAELEEQKKEKIQKEKTTKPNDKEVELFDNVLLFKKEFNKKKYAKLEKERRGLVDEKLKMILNLQNEIKQMLE